MLHHLLPIFLSLLHTVPLPSSIWVDKWNSNSYIQSSGENLLQFKEVSVAPLDKHLEKSFAESWSNFVFMLKLF